ncbi:hypothetical protein C6497_15275 [Candidatus Poribacteria bacterium]|nr:MAG: hypothetical protein C6497_15275 [Candidatus Poribacteria bacterium]
MYNKMLVIVFAIIATFLMYANMANAQLVTKGLVSYWTFDKTNIDDDTVQDVSGENDGTMKGDPKVVEGKVGQALELDGDDYVDFGDPESLNIDPPLTVTMYINNKDASPSFIWQGGEKSGSTKNYIYMRNDGGMNVGQWPPGGGDLNSPKGLLETRGEWYYITAVFDDKYLLYVDGSLESELKSEVYSGPTPTAWLLGTRLFPANAAYYFIGIVDELGVYDRALSEDEINQNRNAGGWADVKPTNKLALTWADLKVSR